MRTRELPVSAVAGGLAVLGGVALWQLGIEFERAWMRSYDGPLGGELDVCDPESQPHARADESAGASGERRWITARQPRRGATTAPVMRARRR
ncbi:MAG TPA: hypothetical protein VGX72_02230 [Solirubrobacteraceae bacterium]|jgi:hypothetical protein|nr:hypothetical protein [Solirubrobacteraceae bacterium]